MCIFLSKIKYCYYYSSSREVVFNAIKRLTQRAEKFVPDKKVRQNDIDWIEKKLTDGNFRKVRDISKPAKSTPTTPAKDSSPLSPKRTVEFVDSRPLGRGKRTKLHKSRCNLECCINTDALLAVRRALFVDDDVDNSDEAIADDGDPDYEDESMPKPKPEPKTPRPRFANVIALQERFNTPDNQVALWWNTVSL